MIRLFEAEKLIINDERNRYFVVSNYEAELFQFFTKHNFWWNIKRNASNFITLNNDIKKISISCRKRCIFIGTTIFEKR